MLACSLKQKLTWGADSVVRSISYIKFKFKQEVLFIKIDTYIRLNIIKLI